MELAILSFIAGVLTVAAPCILPLLPVIIGGTVAQDKSAQHMWYRPLVIVGSLAASVVVFTLLLKATTALLGVPQTVWNVVAGGIVLLFGLNLLAPVVWEKFMLATGLYAKSNQLLGFSSKQKGVMRDVLLGAALGPVFSSCSPTYALIVAAILPASFAQGVTYLIFYAAGLAAVLLLIAVAGQSVVRKLGWLSNPEGWFRRTIGVLFVIVGVAVMVGLDRKFQAFVLEQGWYDPIMKLEQRLDFK
ncbi:MAG TPA: cytochrome c biogenesis protein CcdA [Candidatus Saccharimonadales bacterium]|nr:cytochrome c biogenesis protein CcdA [Candidatus Saccharimonadales bacterium]